MSTKRMLVAYVLAVLWPYMHVILAAFSTPKVPTPFIFSASLLHIKIISWSSWHTLGPYQPPDMPILSLRYTIPYFSSLVDHVISLLHSTDLP